MYIIRLNICLFWVVPALRFIFPLEARQRAQGISRGKLGASDSAIRQSFL